MIDIAVVLSTIGFGLIIGSAFPQLIKNFRQRYVGNQMFIFYFILLVGTALLFPSVIASGRTELFFGTIANVITITLLVLSVLLFRKNKHPRTVSEEFITIEQDKKRIERERTEKPIKMLSFPEALDKMIPDLEKEERELRIRTYLHFKHKNGKDGHGDFPENCSKCGTESFPL